MIRWHSSLYLDQRAKKNIKKINRKLKASKRIPNLYLITMPSNDSNLFDIVSANMITQKYFKKKEIYIFGAAYGTDSVREQLITMLDEVNENTIDFNVRQYFHISQAE